MSISDIPLDLTLTLTPEEEEAFRELERQVEHKRYLQVLQKAQTEAARFVQDQQNDLAMMTLRKAFEIGYRFGFNDAWQEKK
jgi:hypothetical protein